MSPVLYGVTGALIKLTRDGVGVKGGGFGARLDLPLIGVTTVDGFLNEASASGWIELEVGLRFLDAFSVAAVAAFRLRAEAFATVAGSCIGFD